MSASDDLVTYVYEQDAEMEAPAEGVEYVYEEVVDQHRAVDPYSEVVEGEVVYEEVVEGAEGTELYEMEVTEEAAVEEAVLEEAVEEDVDQSDAHAFAEEQQAIVDTMAQNAGAEMDSLTQCRQQLVAEADAEEVPADEVAVEDAAMEAEEAVEEATPAAPAGKGAPAGNGLQGKGSQCQFQPAPTGGAGYVFVCSKSTQGKCAQYRLMGSPDRELPQMQRCIREGDSTLLFLFNLETHTLIGPFTAVGAPRRAIVAAAFGGRFTAQIRVAPTEELQEVKLETRIKAGPKSAIEAKQLKDCLEQGEPLPAEAMEAWRAPIDEQAEVEVPGSPTAAGKGWGWKGGWKGGMKGPAGGQPWMKGSAQMGKGVAGRPWAGGGLKRPWEHAQGPDWAKRPRGWIPPGGLVPGSPMLLEKNLREQIEYYFSDKNLVKDAFFHGKISENAEGWMDASLLLDCRKVKDLGVQADTQIEEALQESHLETQRLEDGSLQVRRATPPPPLNQADRKSVV